MALSNSPSLDGQPDTINALAENLTKILPISGQYFKMILDESLLFASDQAYKKNDVALHAALNTSLQELLSDLITEFQHEFSQIPKHDPQKTKISEIFHEISLILHQYHPALGSMFEAFFHQIGVNIEIIALDSQFLEEISDEHDGRLKVQNIVVTRAFVEKFLRQMGLSVDSGTKHGSIRDDAGNRIDTFGSFEEINFPTIIKQLIRNRVSPQSILRACQIFNIPCSYES